MRTKSRPATQKPPADFAEVKRRFIRQNRELAKCNSSQSLQIRNLQLESQRLLSENLELREQLLKLQNELHRTRRRAGKADRYQMDIRAKLAELSSLVDGMDSFDDHSTTENDERELRRLQVSIHSQWRERIPLTEAMRENQMPTIAEDKLFPRRTLGADEIATVRLSDHSSGGSPDLGPPPVARFDYEEPIKQASPLRPESPSRRPDDGLADNLPMNLEVRRRRKDTIPKGEIRRHSILANSPVKPDNEAPAILRIGAKRKLADRDLDIPVTKSSDPEDFEYSRKLSGEMPADKQPAVAGRNTSAKPIKSARKVLGDKSVNISPRKAATKVEAGLKKDPEKPQVGSVAADVRPPSRGRRTSSIPILSPKHDADRRADIVCDEILVVRPVTPAAADIFSPATSEPSTGAIPSCDTPPPGELSNLSTLSLTSETGRQPRRARSAVNYAEPSLVSKMRRPGKELADAVTGLQDPRRAMSVSTDRKTGCTVSIKKDVLDDDAWKSASTTLDQNAAIGSPLEKRSTTESKQLTLPVAVASKSTDPADQISSSAALTALIAEGRKRRGSLDRGSLSTDNDLALTTKKMEEMDLYEFKDSSSPASDPQKPQAGSTAGRAARRHTLNTKDSQDQMNGGPLPQAMSIASSTTRVSSRRKSMMI